MPAMGSDDHSAFAICTIQRDVFNLRVVAQYIGQKDKEKGATKNDANAPQKGCGILGTIGSKWTQLADFRCRLVTKLARLAMQAF